MVTSRHSADRIAAFTDGETRFIAAAYRNPERRGELFVMPDGQASTLREFTREQLRCLIPDCVAPSIVAVSRSHRRDGFSHKSGGGRYGPETVNHLQGKAIIAEWLRRCVVGAVVAVEAATDTQRSRVADVLVTFAGGKRLAFEVQYAPLTVAEWTARHESYRRHGVVDVWLWGHTRLRPSRSSYDPPFQLDDVQEEARSRGLPVHWLNPDTGEVATALSVLPNGDAITSQIASATSSSNASPRAGSHLTGPSPVPFVNWRREQASGARRNWRLSGVSGSGSRKVSDARRRTGSGGCSSDERWMRSLRPRPRQGRLSDRPARRRTTQASRSVEVAVSRWIRC